MVTERADIRFVSDVLRRRYRPASTFIEDIAIRPVHGQNQGLGVSDTFSVLYITRNRRDKSIQRNATCKQLCCGIEAETKNKLDSM